MQNYPAILLINVAVTGLMALGLTLAGRWIRRPEILHLLWLAVLLKLFMPPVVELAVLPEFQVQEAAVPAAAAALGREPVRYAGGAAATIGPAAVTPAARTLDLLLGVWFAGSVGYLLLTALRGRRFHRTMRRASSGAGRSEVQRDANRLAREMGLRRAPELRLVGARVSPMLWCWPGSLSLLLPLGLLGRLSRGERDTLIAHELAHLRRRDHWVRYLELAVTSLFWWNPVVWWVRRQMRLAEERSCDDWVLRTLPGRARDYAEGLLKTVEFLSGSPAISPALASGVGRGHKLESRLIMILNHANHRTLSLPGRLALGLAVVAVLAVFPGQGRGDTGDSPSATGARGEETSDLQRREVELELKLEQLRARRMELEHELATLRTRRQIENLEHQSRSEEAEELREHLELLERRESLERTANELEQHRIETVARLEDQLRSLQHEIDASTPGSDAAMREADERVRALEKALQLAVERAHARTQAQHEARRLALQKAEVDSVERRRVEHLIQSLAVLDERIAQAEQQGRPEEAEALRREYRDLMEDSRRERAAPAE